MRKTFILLVAVLFVAGCSRQAAERHPEHDDCWVITQSGGFDDGEIVDIACSAEVER